MSNATFIPLKQFLSASIDADNNPAEAFVAEQPCAVSRDEDEISSCARRFLASIEDAIAIALPDVLTQIALTVLGRELTLGPTDINGILARLLSDYAADAPLRVRVHPIRVAEICVPIPVIGDATLGFDDCILELQTGEIDARFATRVELLLSCELH